VRSPASHSIAYLVYLVGSVVVHLPEAAHLLRVEYRPHERRSPQETHEGETDSQDEVSLRPLAEGEEEGLCRSAYPKERSKPYPSSGAVVGRLGETERMKMTAFIGYFLIRA